MGSFAVILPAAGRSSRFGDPKQKKIYAELDGRAVWLRAVEPFVNRDDVAQMIVAIAPEDRELFERRYRPSVAFLNITVIDGGAERSDSIARALEAVDPSCEFVAVHDAARPCLTAELVDAVFAAGPRARRGVCRPCRWPTRSSGSTPRPRHDVETVPRRRPLRRPDAPGLPPRPAPAGLRQPARLGAGDHRRRPARRGDRPPLRVSSTAPVQPQDHDRRRPALASALLQAMPKPRATGPAHPFADERSDVVRPAPSRPSPT